MKLCTVQFAAPRDMHPPLMALTLIQPWASVMMAGLKQIENRWFPPPINMVGERIAIHAGLKFDDGDQWKLRNQLENPAQFDKVPRGCLLGTIKIVGWVDRRRQKRTGAPVQHPGLTAHDAKLVMASNWTVQECDCHWLLVKPILLAKPIPWSGALNFWPVPDEHRAAFDP